MAIDFATFFQVAPYVLSVKKPILLRGRHGVGKSQVVYQVAESLELPVVERRASQMTEGDLIGLPSISGDSTSFNPPDWFKQACDEPVMLFLDEIDRATIEVRQGIFELTDSRKMNGHRLHPDTLIIAAVNGGEHAAQYQVGEMDPAEIDRWTVFDVEPTVEDWLTWAKDKVNDIIWDFINQNRSHLEHETDFEPNKVYPSRRSWDRVNECLEAACLLGDDTKTDIVYNLCVGFVGFEASVAFADFVRNYERQVTVDDLLVHGKIEKTSHFDINDHSAMVEKMEASGSFSEKMSQEKVENLAKYFMTLPSEVAMKLWAVLGSDSITAEVREANVVALHQARVDGRSVQAHLVEILTGENI
tara:strand:+ start:704 stop:1783 length:1080 start_codon:yes stop_codon:yes gene_type:complete